MLIHPDLAALRSNDTPQRLAQANIVTALDAWRDQPEARTIADELALLADGLDLERLPMLSALFAAESGAALALASRLVGAIVPHLAANPLAQVPLRHSCDPAASTLMLARKGGVTLVLQAIDGHGRAQRPAPLSASFMPGETWECVLAGSAQGESVILASIGSEGGVLDRIPVRLTAGQVLHRNGASEALLVGAVDGVLVSLKLQRRPLSGSVAREYALADGRLLHQAAASSRDSRLELAAALLGRMGRADAAPLLAEMADEKGSPALRWQALRECLGLDTALGFAALCRIAENACDPLCPPAGGLRAQLIERYPQLAGHALCPA